MKYSLRKILRAKPKGFPKLSLYFIVFPDSSHNTYILNYKSSIDLSVRLILEKLILRIAPTAGQYRKILPTNIDICQKTSHFFQIALTPKQAGLMWTFFYWMLHDLDNYYVKKIQPKSSSVRHHHESNLKKVRSLFAICQYLWVVRVGLTQLYCSSLEPIILMLITAVHNGGSTMYASAAIPNIPHHSSHTQYSPPLSWWGAKTHCTALQSNSETDSYWICLT